jgi:hypothetical protein
VLGVAIVVLGPACVVSSQEQQLPHERTARLVAAAVEQTRRAVAYDGSYRRIPYPGGDVPPGIGVCRPHRGRRCSYTTSVVVRSSKTCFSRTLSAATTDTEWSDELPLAEPRRPAVAERGQGG